MRRLPEREGEAVRQTKKEKNTWM